MPSTRRPLIDLSGPTVSTWFDFWLWRARFMVWRGWMWHWPPILDRDFYGTGAVVLWVGIVWLEWLPARPPWEDDEAAS